MSDIEEIAEAAAHGKGDKVIWGVMAAIGVGAIIGGLMNLYEAGKQYGRREMFKRLKERNEEHER